MCWSPEQQSDPGNEVTGPVVWNKYNVALEDRRCVVGYYYLVVVCDWGFLGSRTRTTGETLGERELKKHWRKL